MSKTSTPDFRPVYDRAVAAAKEAVAQCRPTPMIVGQAKGLFSSEMIPGTESVVLDGVCGFAWISFKGNTAFGRWAKAQGLARPGYPSGLQISAFKMAPEINQSMQKGEAAVAAAAKVLREAGIEVYTGSRID